MNMKIIPVMRESLVDGWYNRLTLHPSTVIVEMESNLVGSHSVPLVIVISM
jgi:hypothetical protein